MQAPLYETQKLLHEYLLFHYGSPEEVMPWGHGPREALGFPVRTVSELIKTERLPADAAALDLGCAVGRSSFELARHCAQVLGIDYSHSFIQAAAELKKNQSLPYTMLVEARQTSAHTAQLPAGVDASRVRFEQGDAMHLRADLPAYDVVHAANLLCRLTQPGLLLARLPELVKPGGQLLLTTPCTWLEDFTPPEHWPQGSTRDWLISHLEQNFHLDHEADLPFVIREHARKYRWTVAWATRWIRR